MKLTVGQELWFVRHHGVEGAPVKVVTVGRKWATLDNRVRFNMTDGRVENGWGTVWRSEAAHQEQTSLRHAWRQFRRTVMDTRDPPAHVTRAQIDDMSRALFNKETDRDD